MPRSLTAPQLVEIQKQIVNHFYLVSIATSSSTRYFSTGGYDITYNGDIYLATADVISIGDYEEEVTLSANLKRITLSGANQANYNIMLTEFSTNHEAKIFLVLNHTETIPLFDGVILTMGIRDSALEIECQNKWTDVKPTARVHSVRSQQRFHPLDLGFTMNKGLEDKKIEWGKGVE